MSKFFTELHIRPDSIDQPFRLIGLLNSFHNKFQAKADEAYEEISWMQMFILNCIDIFDVEPSIKDVAELAGCSRQNVKQILSKLENKGFVLMRQDEQDKRKQRVQLTTKASEYKERYRKIDTQVMKILFSKLDSAEVETTIRIIEQLQDMLDTVDLLQLGKND